MIVVANTLKIQKISRKRSRLPFDWRNPFGYLIAIAIQLQMMAFALRHVAYMFSLGIGFYAFAWSLIDESKSEITSLNEFINGETPRSELLTRICGIIHSSYVKR